ncbi:hypothetical protein NG895_22825 [Aeoliella sp. ICT_H6.2]|uniref:Cytochrome c-552/4 domain-containing protein n=1 Tax=Aeoliella straminimaris TaxID=2954799 RepID=A0A9X2FJ61_9BACT|nr:multiheme c-type cytochrome [Aeoliella straminimaris]MCO6046741.1 hypothetical protein [Aeoliella straminimaris]
MTKHPAIRRSRPFLVVLLLFAAPMWAAFAFTDNAASETPHETIRVGPKFEARFVAKPVVELAAGHKPKPDPIEANGPIFVDWPKPDLAMVFTGEQMGFLEPCGCAGLENQKGGFKRRMTMMKQLRDQGWPIVAMDTGGLVRRYGPQAQIKLGRILEGLVEMDYSAVGFGEKELKLDMLSEAANLSPNPLVSANVVLVDPEFGFTRPYRVVEKNGFKVGMTAVLGKQGIASVASMTDLVTVSPEEGIQQVLPKLLAENCDEMVLLVYGEVSEAKALSAKFPQFRWVVAGKGGDEPPKQATPIPESGANLIEIGHKGMYAVVIGIYKQGQPRYRYQKVPMDHRFEDAPEMQQLMVRYQNQLKTLVTSGKGWEPLTGKPLATPGGGSGFVGSEVCADCHTDACDVFMKSPHAHATETLVQLDPPRHFDPECVSCHVTGWNPQGFAPYVTGYESLEKTPHLKMQGCENCHGPAKDHYDAEMGNIDATDTEIENFRAALRMKVVENEGNMEGQVLGDVVKNCLECHDLDNSPDFDFQDYWDRDENPVKHEGKY